MNLSFCLIFFSLILVSISDLRGQTRDRSFAEKLQSSLTNVEIHFSQDSSSPIFGTSKEKGQIYIGEKGQFRMDYDSGISISSDGKTILQYDPSTRTATRSEISSDVRNHGLWSIINYQESSLATQVTEVHPNLYKVVGLVATPVDSPIQFIFGNLYLESVKWIDSSGGTQIFSFTKMKPLRDENRNRLILTLPNKTRWIK